MNNILQSIAWWGFVPDKLSPKQFVRAVAESGFAGIDLVPQEYWSLVTSYGLTIVSSEAHASISLGLNRYDQHERIAHEFVPRGDAIEALQTAYRLCAACL